ncbi:hypothetical protein V1290_002828 [Bradyrhizobium sp. AZCC 1578]|uniref:hypothetical protein n=1 Tax=Bradyrhizobium sp. AZCC 1578 TaxID=3117027 RepID=UPI002FF2C198
MPPKHPDPRTRAMFKKNPKLRTPTAASPDAIFGTVKARAIELLRNGDINDYLPSGLIAERWRLQSQIKLAVCIARDALIPPGMCIGRRLAFNKADHASVANEIKRELLAGQHAEDEPKFSDFMRSSCWPDFVASNEQLYRLLLDRGVERGAASELADHLWKTFLAFRREQLALTRQYDAEIAP